MSPHGARRAIPEAARRPAMTAPGASMKAQRGGFVMGLIVGLLLGPGAGAGAWRCT